MRHATLLALGAFMVLGVASCRCGLPPETRRTYGVPYAPLIGTVEGGTEEERYFALLALARHDSAVVRARLRELLDHEHALTRNAAARALVELGEEDAAEALIANLHRDERTYVVTDAIFHLRELFRTDLGYEPNRGYRHQTEKQAEWWAWWERRGHEQQQPRIEPDPNATARWLLAVHRERYETTPYADEASHWAAAAQLWNDAGEIASSRHASDVAVVAGVFQALAADYPDHASLQNNAALSALNAGRRERAAKAYRRAVVLEPEDAGIRNDHGILLEALGRLEEAEAAYRRATEIAPDDDTSWANLGDVLRKQGRTEEAREAYGIAERIAPEKWYYHRLWLLRLGSVQKRRCSRERTEAARDPR